MKLEMVCVMMSSSHLSQNFGASLAAAKNNFISLYGEKTANEWGVVPFAKKPGKFYPLEIDYGQSEDSASLSKDAGSNSKLAPEIQDLIKIIFDVESMKKAMREFEVWINVMCTRTIYFPANAK